MDKLGYYTKSNQMYQIYGVITVCDIIYITYGNVIVNNAIIK